MSIIRQFQQETEMAAAVAENVVSFREARAQRIRQLAGQWAENTFELGKELKAARDSFPTKKERGNAYSRPGWEEWCKTELGFTVDNASRLIRIAERFSTGAAGALAVGSAKLLDFLARETTPESVRKEVVERIERGENVGHGTAQKIKEQHTAPPPEEARKIARETGKPTLARDGNIYLGATKAQEREIEARRTIVFDVRRAVETLSGMKMTPEDFLGYAPIHLHWNKEEEHMIHEALDWLTDLVTAWERR